MFLFLSFFEVQRPGPEKWFLGSTVNSLIITSKTNSFSSYFEMQPKFKT